MLENFFYLLVGSFLGVSSHFIITRIQTRQKKKNIQKTLISELDEFRYKLICLVYTLTRLRCKWNRDFFEWIKPYLDSYEGIHKDNKLLESVLTFLTQTDKQISSLNQPEGDNPLRTKSLKKYYLPFLESIIDYISLFPVEVQRQLLDIRSQVLVFNDMIDESQRYHFMTFDSSINEKNHEIVNINITYYFDSIIQRSEFIVKSIDVLLSKSSQSSDFIID